MLTYLQLKVTKVAATSIDIDCPHDDDDDEERLKRQASDANPVVVLTRLSALERLIDDLVKKVPVADKKTTKSKRITRRFSPEVQKAFEELRCLRAEKAVRKWDCEYCLASYPVVAGLAKPCSGLRKRRSEGSDGLLNDQVPPARVSRQQPSGSLLGSAGRAVDVTANRSPAINLAAAEPAKPRVPPTYKKKRGTSEEREPRFKRRLGPRRDTKTTTKRARQLDDQQSSCSAVTDVLERQKSVVVSATKQKRIQRTSALWGLSEPNGVHRRLLKRMAQFRQPLVRKTTSFEERARATAKGPLSSVVNTLASCSRTARPEEPTKKQGRFLCFRCGHVAESRADRLKHVAEHASDCSCCSDFYKRCSNHQRDSSAGVCRICRERVPHLFAHTTLHHGDAVP